MADAQDGNVHYFSDRRSNLKPGGGGGTFDGMPPIDDIAKRMTELEATVKSLPGYPGMIGVVGLIVGLFAGLNALYLNSALSSVSFSLSESSKKNTELSASLKILDDRIRSLEVTFSSQKTTSDFTFQQLNLIDDKVDQLIRQNDRAISSGQSPLKQP